MRNQVEIKIEGMSVRPLPHSFSLARNLLFQEFYQIRSKHLYSSLLSSISATLIRPNIKKYLNGNIFSDKKFNLGKKWLYPLNFPRGPAVGWWVVRAEGPHRHTQVGSEAVIATITSAPTSHTGGRGDIVVTSWSSHREEWRTDNGWWIILHCYEGCLNLPN